MRTKCLILDDEAAPLPVPSVAPGFRVVAPAAVPVVKMRKCKAKTPKATPAKKPKSDPEQANKVTSPVIRSHRVVREQLQFMVQHPGKPRPRAETQYVYGEPQLLDKYLGGLIGITGSKYAHKDECWLYLMQFSKFPGQVFPVPAAEGEEWVVFDESWQAEYLSIQGAPAPAPAKKQGKSSSVGASS